MEDSVKGVFPFLVHSFSLWKNKIILKRERKSDSRFMSSTPLFSLPFYFSFLEPLEIHLKENLKQEFVSNEVRPQNQKWFCLFYTFHLVMVDPWVVNRNSLSPAYSG